jgi:GGDEF domain-containing protein
MELLTTLPGFADFRDRLAMEHRRAASSHWPLSLVLLRLKPLPHLIDEIPIATALSHAVKALSRKLRARDSIYHYLPVTIIVGVLCKDGLAVASDSQAQSFRGVETKRMDYLKIHEICNEKDGCLVAVGAGMVAFISKTIDKLADLVNSTKMT